MTFRGGLVVALVVLTAGCSHQAPMRSAEPSPAPLDVAVPYLAPAHPPQRPKALDVQPSRDADDRLARVMTGKLVDSGDFHTSSFNAGDPPQSDAHSITFTTPSGHITCQGGPDALRCLSDNMRFPQPPRPVEAPIGNWEPFVDFVDGRITYGISAGMPLLPANGRTLPYGSTVRFGDVECLSARDGITCVDVPSSSGFHLSRDDLTPLRAIDAIAADGRVEPRTPGSPFCGAVVGHAALVARGAALPNNGGWHYDDGGGDYYTCRDLQLFQILAYDTPGRQLPANPAFVLVFDRGRFVTGATDHPYPGLSGALDKADPTLIHLQFYVVRDGRDSHPTIRARYRDGAVTLLEPIPDGATPAA